MPNDWDDRELREEDAESTSWEEGRSWLPWALWALIPIALGILWFSLRVGEPPATPSESAVGSEAPAAAPEEPADVEEAVKLPPLAESDSFVRERALALSKDPWLALLLEPGELVRKLVVSVANISEGMSPRKQLVHIRPEESFSALETRERVVLDPKSFERYGAPAQFFASLDARAVAGIYRVLEPLFDEAHAELGLSDRSGFKDTLSRAIEVLLAAPVVEGPIRLRAVNVNYVFEDPALEKLPPAQKHLVRMGPENTRRIQKKLRELKDAFALR